VLEEVWPELVACILAAQLSGGDEGASDDHMVQTCRVQVGFERQATAQQPFSGAAPSLSLNCTVRVLPALCNISVPGAILDVHAWACFPHNPSD
jgi:hypothetical protein